MASTTKGKVIAKADQANLHIMLLFSNIIATVAPKTVLPAFTIKILL